MNLFIAGETSVFGTRILGVGSTLEKAQDLCQQEYNKRKWGQLVFEKNGLRAKSLAYGHGHDRDVFDIFDCHLDELTSIRAGVTT